MRKEKMREKKIIEGKRLEETRREEIGCNREKRRYKKQETRDEAREEDEMR